jgi:hypothetical protein
MNLKKCWMCKGIFWKRNWILTICASCRKGVWRCCYLKGKGHGHENKRDTI